MDLKSHWEQTYGEHPHDRLGWYTAHLTTSLEWIAECGLRANQRIVDVGGGASTLAGDLLAAGFRSISVVDLSARALATARQRLGDQADRIDWLEADVLEARLPIAGTQLWHDRAVFHFLVDDDRRQRYRRQLLKTLVPGGRLILATFAPDGPERCSGLPVRRHGADDLEQFFGPDLALEASRPETHITPSGRPQHYTCCRFHRPA